MVLNFLAGRGGRFFEISPVRQELLEPLGLQGEELGQTGAPLVLRGHL